MVWGSLLEIRRYKHPPVKDCVDTSQPESNWQRFSSELKYIYILNLIDLITFICIWIVGSILSCLVQWLLCGKMSYLVLETLIGLWASSPRKTVLSLLLNILNWDVTMLSFLFILTRPGKKALIFRIIRLRHLYNSKDPLNREIKNIGLLKSPYLFFFSLKWITWIFL